MWLEKFQEAHLPYKKIHISDPFCAQYFSQYFDQKKIAPSKKLFSRISFQCITVTYVLSQWQLTPYIHGIGLTNHKISFENMITCKLSVTLHYEIATHCFGFEFWSVPMNYLTLRWWNQYIFDSFFLKFYLWVDCFLLLWIIETKLILLMTWLDSIHVLDNFSSYCVELFSAVWFIRQFTLSNSDVFL